MAEVRTPLPISKAWFDRADWVYLAVLLALVIPLRGWLIYNTEVTARDSIGYIRYALQFENPGLTWKDILLKNHQHPGYPLSIWAVSLPVRAVLGPANPENMRLSAQLASNMAAVLLVVPMFFLGKFFFERRVAFWGTLLFQYLPVTGQHLSDGVSEALFLLFTSTAFLFAIHAMRRQSASLFAGCGFFCGLSYLTRPEGAMVLVAALAVLIGRQCVAAWRQDWRSTLRCAATVTFAGLLVGSSYFGFTLKFTNKPNVAIFVPVTQQEPARKKQEAKRAEGQATTGPLFATVWAASSHRQGTMFDRLGSGIAILSMELLQLFQYVGLAAVGLGMLWHLPRLVRVPEFLIPMAFVAVHCLLVLALVCNAGYLSDRHLMVIAVWWVFFAAVALLELPARLLAIQGSQKSATVLSAVLLLAFFSLCLPRTVQRIHGNRVGNHQAGLWLAQRLERGDVVNDDHNWSHYYAGLVFKEGENPELPAGYTPRCYVVMTRSHIHDVHVLRQREEAALRAAKGTIVFHWPEEASADEARIVVYAMPRDFRTQGWRVRAKMVAARN